MDRTFQHYYPIQIARFVKRLFRGSFMVVGCGSFRFDNGRILLPKSANLQQLHMMKEINGAILAMK